MLGLTGFYYGLSPYPGPMTWNEPRGGVAYADTPISPPDTLAGFGCRANRNNAGYDEGEVPRARGGIGRASVPIEIPREEDLMSETVGDFLVKRLSEWGVKRIFGYPGDGSTGILGGRERAREDPE